MTQSARSMHLEEVVKVITIDSIIVPIFHPDITSVQLVCSMPNFMMAVKNCQPYIRDASIWISTESPGLSGL